MLQKQKVLCLCDNVIVAGKAIGHTLIVQVRLKNTKFVGKQLNYGELYFN